MCDCSCVHGFYLSVSLSFPILNIVELSLCTLLLIVHACSRNLGIYAISELRCTIQKPENTCQSQDCKRRVGSLEIACTDVHTCNLDMMLSLSLTVYQVRLDWLSLPVHQVRLDWLSLPVYQVRLDWLSLPVYQVRLDWLSLPVYQVRLDRLSLPVYQVRLDWLPLPCIALIRPNH